jgi:hypothetical protein
MTVENLENAGPDTLHRGVKMALDSGEVATVEEAYRLFAGYRLTVIISPAAAASAAHQAALVTIVNAGRRAFLGGVQVVGQLDAPIAINLEGPTLRDAVLAHGGLAASSDRAAGLVIVLGEVDPPAADIVLQATFSGLAGGVFPAGEGARLTEEPGAVLPAILAGALAMSELFQNLRGNPMAGLREVGLSMWDPSADWRTAGSPKTYFLPSQLWVIGLGHLGQALTWIMGLTAAEQTGAVDLTLQDFDRLTLANDSTSVLTTAALIGEKKTRAIASWAETRGMATRVVERRFDGDLRLQADEPRIAFCGVDNGKARAMIDEAGFDLVVEAGLGGGPREYLAMRLHTFPAARTSAAIWGADGQADAAPVSENAYRDLEGRGFDKCGLVELATRTVGAPFVGLVAASLALGEMIRRLGGLAGTEVIDLTLRDISNRSVIAAAMPMRGFNPGFIAIGGEASDELAKKSNAVS